MSGDVQPRKRKDKKRKKDEPSLEEHRGTSATFGEGDVQIHSQQDHGTGGHWCAKIIFFSLLAVLVTLIGLIILENRGLSELEANAVESQYSGILDGWIEDTPENDHHDEHTLELKHHEHHDDDDDDAHGLEDDQELQDEADDDEHSEEVDHDEVDIDDDEDHEEVDDAEEDENDDEDDENDDESVENMSKELDEDDDDNGSDEVEVEHKYEDDDDEVDEEPNIKATEASYEKSHEVDDDINDDDNLDDNNQDDDDEDKEELDDANESEEQLGDGDDNLSDELANNGEANDGDERVNTQSDENDDQDDENSEEKQDYEDDEEHEEDHKEEEEEEEIEKIEQEVLDQEEPESAEVAQPYVSVEKEAEASLEAVSSEEEYEVDEKEFLEVDELDEPAVERIAPPPPGKPYVEIEEEVSVEVPTDTLAAEEEYEKQQEELRQQEAESSSHMWLKLAVGGALLAATHAVIRRATAPRDAPENERDEHASREETPITDRRMTLIPEQAPNVIPQQTLQPKIEEEIVPKLISAVKAAPVVKQDSEELEEDVAIDEEVEEDEEVQIKKDDRVNKELYSDDEENEDEEIVEEEEEIEEKKEAPKSIFKPPVTNKQPESKPEELADDVEIIDDDIDEEVEEEVEDEEEISDVDDAELLSRLEAKYGRLPEPERPRPQHKDGGNSLEDDWPGEPSDPFWREQLDKAEQELRQGSWASCAARAGDASLAASARARWLRARALDSLAEEKRDNNELTRAIGAYVRVLEMNERLSDEQLRQVAARALDRIQFRGTYLKAEPVYRLLIRRFPNDVTYRNNLTISFLMANRADLATDVLKETLRLWPNDRLALAHYGFVLKTEQNNLEEAVAYFARALEGDAGGAGEARFYYHWGDALLALGRRAEADAVHRRGAALGHFLSPEQRSLYNVPRLRGRPWWDVNATPYAKLARDLEKSWREILKEGEAARALYEREREGLRERGAWSQLDVLVRGREVGGRCARAPVTCSIVKSEPAALCRRGQVKFSLLEGGTHVRAHVGPTNCRLRMHLALTNTAGAALRVAHETRQWQVGKVLMFDDSFEHEVWHNGTAARLVLIVDVWHPDLTPHERRTLPAI